MDDSERTSERHWQAPAAIALCALVLILATLDSNGLVPRLGEGPGLTLDETFNVQMGVYHVRAIQQYGFALTHPDSLDEVFNNPGYNPDHPPLGRLLIGIAHELTMPLFDPQIPPQGVCVTCGRVAAAFAFAATVLLVGWTASRWYGRGAGAVAALSMLLMPRLFAHGHIASLETFVNLAYLIVILWVVERWNGERRPGWWAVLFGGVLFGLCLLTKIQAVLLPVPIGLWALWRWRWRGVLPMVLFGLTGLAVFFVGWPWLWVDPLEHLREYFGRTTDRQTLYCWYLGRKWSDTAVPWHYTLVMFAVTVPIGLHALGVLGATVPKADDKTRNAEALPDRSPLSDPRSAFLLLNVLWPLVFFALPGITTYDGCRLFLTVFPLWAILIGRGGQFAWDCIHQRWGRLKATIAIGLLLAAQCVGVITMHPLQLSYYNIAVGGLRGADRLGFEATYWGDSVTRGFLEQVERHTHGSPIDVAPVLHPFQLKEWHDQGFRGAERSVLLPFTGKATGSSFVVVFRRHADSWEELTPQPIDGRLIAEVRREGVQLAALYELPADDQPTGHEPSPVVVD